MATTVLGKRARSSDRLSAPTSTTIASRVKRRSTRPAVQDENDDPFRPVSTRVAAEVESDIVGGKHSTSAAAVTTPTKAKHHRGRVALSPTKINTHFKACKVSSNEKTEEYLPRTPQTPRHHDVLAKKAAVTPRQRVTPIGKPLTPRTPRTGRTALTASSRPSVYEVARQLFVRSGQPGRLVGREQERKELRTFVDDRVRAGGGGAVYVSGPPGTGKSALVNEVCHDSAEEWSLPTAYVNCMSMRSGDDLCARLSEQLRSDVGGLGLAEDGKESLQRLFTGTAGEGCLLVVLDEIDHLLTVDLELLYGLFEWSFQPSSRLILIGIANALDLTDRFLPRLKARKLKPQLVPFLPYTAPQINSVITTRLRALLPDEVEAGEAASKPLPFFHPAAVLLCSRKVASQTGDLRKAYEISRRALDLVEREARQKCRAAEADDGTPVKAPLSENTNLSSPASERSPLGATSTKGGDAFSSLTVESAPRVTVAHIGRVSAAAFGHGTNARLQTLNLQQKAALCALVALEKRKRGLANPFATPSKADRGGTTMRALFDGYTSLCRQDRVLHPLTSTEFRDVMSSLETLSLVAQVEGRGQSTMGLATPSKVRGRGFGTANVDDKRVVASVSEAELAEAVEGVGAGILKAMLAGELD